MAAGQQPPNNPRSRTSRNPKNWKRTLVLDPESLERFDKWWPKVGFRTRSQAFRYLLKAWHFPQPKNLSQHGR